MRLFPGIVTAAIVASGFARADTHDPYIWLEDVNGPRAMAWVQAENAKTTAVLETDSRYAALYADALTIAQAKDRIPNPTTLQGAIYNFWQDADHVRGLWRRTSLADYTTADPHWQTILDLDAMAAAEKANWVYKGADCVEPSEARCMVDLSDGGEDAVTVREFDLGSAKFADGGFVLPHGKQRSAWQDDNTLLVSREWQAGELTTSGYPFIVKRVKRGESFSAAKEIFRGTAEDGGYGVTPVSLHDGDGHQAVIINRPLSTFESENYLVTKTGVAKLGLPLKSNIEALVSGALVVSIDQDWDAGQAHIAPGTLVALDLADVDADPVHLKPVALYALARKLMD